MIVAKLADARADRIVVGGRALWLRDGESCAYTVGTPVRVVYTVVDGRRLVDGIMVVARADEWLVADGDPRDKRATVGRSDRRNDECSRS